MYSNTSHLTPAADCPRWRLGTHHVETAYIGTLACRSGVVNSLSIPVRPT
jgi:hypothetical protein